MADEFDHASELEEWALKHALHEQAKKAAEARKIHATGRCLYCDEPLPDGHRWCNAECRDDWQRENPDK